MLVVVAASVGISSVWATGLRSSHLGPHKQAAAGDHASSHFQRGDGPFDGLTASRIDYLRRTGARWVAPRMNSAAAAAALDSAEAHAAVLQGVPSFGWFSYRPRYSPAEGPAVLECHPVQQQKFYLYEFEFAKTGCKTGPEVLQAVKMENMERRQQWGPELFLHQQLRDHPWRTMDPSEATLFVVPSIFAVPNGPSGFSWEPLSLVCNMRLEDLVAKATKELLESPWYQRNQGSDHLLVMLDWKGRRLIFHDEDIRKGGMIELRVYTPDENLFRERMATLRSFRHTARNFLIAGRFSSPNAHLNGRPWNRLPSGAKLMAIPYLAPSVIDYCQADEASGRITCVLPKALEAEESFAAYRRARNTTLFFLGNGCRKEVKSNKGNGRASATSLRPLVIYNISDVRPPSILADTGKCMTTQPNCSFVGEGPTAGCKTGPVRAAFVASKLREAMFAIHVRGDDASSSRVYEALAYGAPQLFLAARFYHDVAPFKCNVPYDRAFAMMDEDAFAGDPRGEMEALLSRMMDGPDATEWEQLWTAQRKAAGDLLWHTPDSRVGHNIIQDALRLLSSE